MSNAFWAYGSQLKLGDGGGSEVFTAIAEITTISGPTMSRDSIDVSSHDSANGWREFIPGFRDAGEITTEGNWLPTNATHDETTGILETFTDDVLHNFQLVLPSALKTLSFSAFVTSFETDLTSEEEGKLNLTLKISGAVTYA